MQNIVVAEGLLNGVLIVETKENKKKIGMHSKFAGKA